VVLKLAWRNIWRNKRRTIITLSSIAFAVFFSVIMQSMQLGSYERMIENVVKFYTGYVQIHSEGYWEEKILDKSFEPNSSLISEIARLEGVEQVVPRLESFALSSYQSQTRGALIMGFDPVAEKKLTALHAKIIEGEYLTENDNSVLLSQGLAEYLKIKVSDTVVLIGQGYHAINAVGKYHVKGIIKFPAPAMNNQLVAMPILLAQWFYGAENKYTALALVLDSPDNVQKVSNEIVSILGRENLEVMTWQEMMPEIVQQIELDYVSGQVMLWILYAVVAFGIFGTFLMMTNERRYEMGIMIAVGLRRIRMQMIMGTELLLMGFSGTLAGIIMAMPLLIYFYFNPIRFTGEYQKLSESFGYEAILPFSMDAGIFLYQAMMVFLITIILGIYPLNKIHRLRIADAMRN